MGSCFISPVTLMVQRELGPVISAVHFGRNQGASLLFVIVVIASSIWERP